MVVDKLSSLSIFMPAFNEAGNIHKVVKDAVAAAKSFTKDYEIIVVNDGSRDETAAMIVSLSKQNPHIKLISHQENRGYGAAVKTGMGKASKDWIFFTDSDGQFHFDELNRFVIARDKADLIIGYRKKRMDPFHRVFVAQVLLKTWNFLLFGLTVRDVDCAFKLFPKKVRDNINLTTESAITVTEFIVKAKAQGYKIKELPVHHYPRRFGAQTGGNWRVILKAALESFRLYKQLRDL
jgi:glycosyltransferase involved in cell wall biosynthesis